MLASDTVVSLARKPRDAQAAHRVAPFPQWFLGVTIADDDAMGSAWITPENQAVGARCRRRKFRCCGTYHHHKTPARRRSNIRPNRETDHAEPASAL